MSDQNTKKDNVLPFRPLNTSKDDGGSTGNWLKDMVQGTRFLASQNAENSSDLVDFIVASDPKAMPAVYLGRNINSPDGGFKFYRPDKFVRDYTFWMTLEILERPDGNDNQIPAGELGSNDQPQKRPKVHARKQRVPPGSEPGEV